MGRVQGNEIERSLEIALRAWNYRPTWVAAVFVNFVSHSGEVLGTMSRRNEWQRVARVRRAQKYSDLRINEVSVSWEKLKAREKVLCGGA